ncbi:hypothetical protein EPA93_03970 [Ktedonosporobacter rubrisoli]|uniref:DUF3847 domain-containing protein n=1 Tax=Ktedonosporobacter rubrisoli TaxID=2509675 RepID=A0A4P6JJA8_KTERU|nr:hypothetical protein [Ktedonosporobacter rubrisoli]QBD75194.1 hypothetical protein EPA93_03970 [Ktedonosporobacter rubrisoli]
MSDSTRPRRPKEPKKKSARLTNIDAQIAALQRERETEAKRINEEEYKKDTRRKILMGQAVLKEAQRREPVRKFMYNLLNRDLTRPGDRALFDDLMEEWGMPRLPPLDSIPPTPVSGGPVDGQAPEENTPEMEDA